MPRGFVIYDERVIEGEIEPVAFDPPRGFVGDRPDVIMHRLREYEDVQEVCGFPIRVVPEGALPEGTCAVLVNPEAFDMRRAIERTDWEAVRRRFRELSAEDQAELRAAIATLEFERLRTARVAEAQERVTHMRHRQSFTRGEFRENRMDLGFKPILRSGEELYRDRCDNCYALTEVFELRISWRGRFLCEGCERNA